ncbi:hypothetical protein Droror1_Dr00003903 [Drosera rotundifolia]
MDTQTPFQLHSTILTPPPHIFTSHILKPVSSSIPSYGSLNSPKSVSNSLTTKLNPQLHHFQMGRVISGPRSNFWSSESGVMNRGVITVWCQGSDMEEEDEDEDRFYMRRAVELAREGIGCTSPNPMVGCIIVKDGKIVGEGFHPKAGQPHAEVFAIRDAGDFAENATAYVSLEPCNHYGRTPPCTEALMRAKVKKVVVGMVDPNPIVASKGVERLRDAGIEVVVGVEEDLCKQLNQAYIHKMLTGKPFVTLRYTISTDGKILDQLAEGVTESGGYYSKLLQEYDVIIHSSTTLAKQSFLPTSKEPKANQPLHVLIAKSPSLIQVPNLPSDTARKAIIFTDADSSGNTETAQMGIETVVADEISLDAILEYCKNQGACNVLIDFRGDSGDLEEILKVALEKKQVQKLLVEVSPFWAGPRWKVSPTKRILQKIGLDKLSSKKIEGGYFELYGSDQFNIEFLASLFRQDVRA